MLAAITGGSGGWIQVVEWFGAKVVEGGGEGRRGAREMEPYVDGDGMSFEMSELSLGGRGVAGCFGGRAVKEEELGIVMGGGWEAEGGRSEVRERRGG